MSAKRRDALKTLFSNAPPEAPANDAADTAEAASGRPVSGAVKAMGLSLSGLAGEIDAARALKRELAETGRIVDLDPGRIDAALVADRLNRDDEGDPAFVALVASIGENGQQVPVLVRPHPQEAGRYQAAYGHRRIQAARRLGIRVKAIVRDLTDGELVLAQGKENTERRDLSFIERALFAKALVDYGFERRIVQQALSLHKAEMTRLLQVADAVPAPVAHAVGPAPKIGRPRWLALAGLLGSEAGRVKADDEIRSERFRNADSNRRFKLLFERLSKKPVATKPREIASGSGEPVARVVTAGGKPRIDFVGASGPAFAEFVAGELTGLLARFESRSGK